VSFIFNFDENADESSMANPNQTDLLDGMIARLENANAKAYEQFARAVETVPKPKQDASHHPSGQEKNQAAVKQRSSRARRSFLALIGLLLAACACIAAFAWEPSYVDGAKRIIGRWANGWVLQAAPQSQNISRDGAPTASPISAEVAQRFQRMADALANAEKQIEQLKKGQEKIVNSEAAVPQRFTKIQEQIARDKEEVEQLNATLAQMARENAALAKQVKANQEQLAEVALSRTASSIRKRLRRRTPGR
jgi:septal ring factor EnvC (AmiA/AmiB activator)